MPGTSDNQQPESECINTSNNNNNKSNINNNGLDNEVSLVSLPSSSSSSHQSSQHQHHGIISSSSSSSSSTSSSSSSNVSNCSSSAQKRCDVPSTSKTTVPIDINTCTTTTTTATTTTATTTTTTNSTEDGESDLSNDKVHHHEKISRENFLSLIRKHRLSYVILNLYSIDEGYSIGLKKFAENDIIETSKLPYEEKELLEFINNEELPPMLSDIFDSFRESHEAPLFYQGSIFMEIKDHCKNVSKKEPYHESSFVRLRPTNQTILSDVNRITSCLSNAKNWTQEEKTILEAKLVLENSEPLRLDPSPIVAIVNNRLQNERKHNKSQKIIESFINRNSQTALKSRAAKFHSLPAPKGLELCDFLMKRKDLPSIAARLNKKIDCVNNKTFQAPAESLDSKLVEIEKFARKLEPVSLKSDSSLIKADEYVMEFQDSEGRASMTCVTIFHRSIDDSYFGQLFLDKKRDFQNKSVDSCLFRLGHKSMVEKYIAQFKDILTENGRKPVKITHRIPNQASKVSNSTVPNLPNHCEKNDLEIREPLYKKPKILQSHPKNGIC